MAKHIVATLEEIPPGGRKIVTIAGRSIGVFNLDGEFFALRNRCPHQGGPLCEGPLFGYLEARVPGEYCYSRRGEILRCPWHGWEFDVRTGQSRFDPARLRVRRYPVTLEEGDNEPGASDEATEIFGLQKGPYLAEIYSVSVERQYVVVEI